jgi:DNA invertase Pin-like site-specific DNA recombinase
MTSAKLTSHPNRATGPKPPKSKVGRQRARQDQGADPADACELPPQPSPVTESIQMTRTEAPQPMTHARSAALAEQMSSNCAVRRVMIYARASSHAHDALVEEQVKELRAHIAGRGNWECVGVIAEVDQIQRTEKLPEGLKRALIDQTFDILLVQRMSRLGRNFRKLAGIMEMAHQNGIELHTLEGPVPYGAACCLTEFADLQRVANREQIKRMHLSINRKGLHIGRPPYGYRCAKISGRKGDLTIFAPEARIVRKIFKWRWIGMPPCTIARKLNGMGVRPAQGKKWRAQGVAVILQNAVYKGYVRYNMTTNFRDITTGQSRLVIRPINEWSISRGRHVSIVEEVVFEAVQKLREIRKVVRPVRLRPLQC